MFACLNCAVIIANAGTGHGWHCKVFTHIEAFSNHFVTSNQASVQGLYLYLQAVPRPVFVKQLYFYMERVIAFGCDCH